MTTQNSKDPLDVLQLMVNDVLVQTGKALRASRKDAHGNIPPNANTAKSKLPDTINTFHAALNELEWDIIHAKSVLMRDLKRIQEQKQHSGQLQGNSVSQTSQASEPSQPAHTFPSSHTLQPVQPSQPSPLPQPIESQSKSPMVIDLESSPPPPNDQQMAESKTNKPVAPFPDMGMGMGLADAQEVEPLIKEETTPMPQATLPDGTNIKTTASPAPMAPMPNMDQKSINSNTMEFSNSTGDAHPELNFTNMEFTLVPPNGDSQNPTGTQEPSFDLASFAPSDGNNDLANLESSLSTQTMGHQDNSSAPQPVSQVSEIKPEDMNSQGNQDVFQGMKDENMDSTFEDMFFPDANEFGDGGVDDATFDELMKDDVDEFNSMEHGEFDANYFGLDQTE